MIFDSKVKKAIFSKPYYIFFILFFFLFIILNVIINQVYVTKDVLFDNLYFGIPFIFFNIIVAFLIALNFNLIIIKFKEYKEINLGGNSLAGFGIFSAFLGGACPGCFVGLFPAFLGLFGVTASLAILPLYGIELQAFSVLLLAISAYYLKRNPACIVK